MECRKYLNPSLSEDSIDSGVVTNCPATRRSYLQGMSSMANKNGNPYKSATSTNEDKAESEVVVEDVDSPMITSCEIDVEKTSFSLPVKEV